MNFEKLKEKLAPIATDEAMLGRWMTKVKNPNNNAKAVFDWAIRKKDKIFNVKEFHAALYAPAEQEVVKVEKPAKKMSGNLQKKLDRKLNRQAKRK